MKNLIRFDWAMRDLLLNKANFAILEGFLSELLKEDIQIRQILESKSNQEHSITLFKRVSVLAENSGSELILIEVCNEHEDDYVQQMIFGFSQWNIDNSHLGSDAAHITRIYSINITYSDLGQGKDYIYHGATQFHGVNAHDALKLSTRQQGMLQINTLNNAVREYYLIKVNQFNDIIQDTLDEWMFYLKNNKIENNFSARGLKEVTQLLDLAALGVEERSAYDRYLSKSLNH